MKMPALWFKCGDKHIRVMIALRPVFSERFAHRLNWTVRRWGWFVLEVHPWSPGRLRFKLYLSRGL